MFLREPLFVLLGLLVFSLPLQILVRPKAVRFLQPIGITLHSLLLTGCYGVLLLVSGSPLFAAALTWGITLALVIASNLKWAVLGEPLVFSDLCVVKHFVEHPKFYIFAVPAPTRIGISIALLCIVIGYSETWLHPGPITLRLVAVVLIAASSLGLTLLPVTRLAPSPALKTDISRLGLLGCLFVYWRCWQKQLPAAPPCPQKQTQRATPAFDLIIVVQCESFTDPQTLTLPAAYTLPAMPELARARRIASHYGALEVSSFGAYTIRTEYGVLFGRSEQELGFQQFDPYLTAKNNVAFSLPHKLRQSGYKSVFLHPYTLDFSSRGNLMSHIGFNTVLGAEAFAHTPTPDMPYVPDKTLADKLITLCTNSKEPLLLYAVTIENHGPWQEQGQPLNTYLKHLKNSDNMIGQLITYLENSDRSALLVFFGDHRPSIIPELPPTTERSTPYCVVPFRSSKEHNHKNHAEPLTPAQLHHLIVNLSIQYSAHPTPMQKLSSEQP